MPINKLAQADLTRADALVLDGCYDCLLEAKAIYERVAVGKARPLVIAQLFETELLLTLREKELALDSTASLARSRALATELPPLVEAARYVTIVEAVPADAGGWPRREIEGFRREHVPFVPTINDEVAWLDAATALRQPVRQYIALAIDCSYPTRPRPPRAGAPPPTRLTGPPPIAGPATTAAVGVWPRNLVADASPLVRYRRDLCQDVDVVLLDQVRSASPRFVDTSLFLGRLASTVERVNGAPRVKPSTEHPLKAKDLVEEIYARFPTSPAVTYLAGNFNQARGDCRAALRYYDETLAVKPAHEDALLGRTMCLTFLKRFDDAIQTATHMIELGTDNIAEAFYWRAWIRHDQQKLDLARADIDQAKKLGLTSTIMTLAGIIEHDQDDLDIARRDLQVAKSMVRGNKNCLAMWYLGLVAMKQEQWIESGAQFAGSMTCYASDAKDDEDALKVVQARTDLDADYQATQITGFETAIKEDRSRECAAAFNAANRYAQGGNVPRARELLDIAARDPSLADKVEQLRQIIKGMG